MKNTRVYQLGAYPSDVVAVFCEAHNAWYPLEKPEDKDLFVHGKGHLKCAKWKRETVPALKELTAEGIKTVYDKYGINVALGMVNGWGVQSLFHDQSYGLSYAKHEVGNMAKLGAAYDQATDVIQAIGDRFVSALLANGFRIEGGVASIENGALWYGDKIIGFTDRNVRIHPLHHLEHCIYFAHTKPMFDPDEFDNMLWKLLVGKYGVEASDNFPVSCPDRIADLTGSREIAESFQGIFAELDKLRLPTECAPA